MTSLHQTFGALPIHAFATPEAPDTLLPALFGVDTRVHPYYEHGDTGTWLAGWVAALPSDNGWTAIMIPQTSHHIDVTWDDASPGWRIDRLAQTLGAPLVHNAPDLLALAADLVPQSQSVWTFADGHRATTLGGFAGVSQYAPAWLLWHLMAEFAADHLADQAWTMLALTCDPGAVTTARRTLTSLTPAVKAGAAEGKAGAR